MKQFSPAVLIWVVLMLPVQAFGQPVHDSCSVSVLNKLDSVKYVLDSLETRLLATAQTYQQVKRLLTVLPPASLQLDLLPAVLPIDVPLEGFRISSPFGLRRHPIQKQVLFHAGLDVKAVVGLSVKATGPGVVTQVGFDPVLGVYIRLKHAFGFETTYGHLSGYCVRAGQQVSRNQLIGKVGQTGRTTGPHLHYVIKKNGSVIDPFNFCFLLRTRLRLYKDNNDSAPSKSDSLPDKTLLSKGSYPSVRN